MKQSVKRIAAGWGALATGPAIWALFSMLEKAEVIDLDSPSPYYLLAVIASGLVGTTCMLTSCCFQDRKNDNQSDTVENDMSTDTQVSDARLAALEERLLKATEQIEELQKKLSETRTTSSPDAEAQNDTPSSCCFWR